MYDCYKNNITKGRDSFSIPWIVGDNLQVFIIWGLAGYLLWPIWVFEGYSITGIFWIFFVLVLQILLKKHNCSGCYYYDKLCHLGWGKISSALFRQDSGNPDIGKKLSLLMYVFPLPAVAAASIIYGIIAGVDLIFWAALGLFIIFNILSFPLRKRSCRECAMRKTCDGSACKK